MNVYKIFNLTIFLCAYTTLQTTTRQTGEVQRVFFGRLWVALKKARFCGRVALKITGFFYSRCSKWCPFAFMHARSRAIHWSTALLMTLPWVAL